MTLAQKLKLFKNRTAVGNLIIDDDYIFPVDITNNSLDNHLFVVQTLLAACRDRQSQHTCKMRSRFGIAKIGRNYDGICQIPIPEVVYKHIQRVQMIGWHTEEPMYLRCVQCHCEDTIGSSSYQQIGYQPSCNRDARCVFLV